jgi:hypothetical protein
MCDFAHTSGDFRHFICGFTFVSYIALILFYEKIVVSLWCGIKTPPRFGVGLLSSVFQSRSDYTLLTAGVSLRQMLHTT